VLETDARSESIAEGAGPKNLRARCGALWPVAERFSSRLALSDGATPAERLRALARAIERFADEPGHGEDELIEGAGALLGVLLVEHCRGAHQSRDGQHRVQLGAHGFFDPFAAVARSLDSDDPRAVLARAIREAEAEERGEGPVSRVVKDLCARLADARPDLEVSGHFDRELSLRSGAGEPFTVDLGRAVDSTRDQPASAVERVVQRIVSMLPRPDGEVPEVAFTGVRAQLVPRLVLRAVVMELSERGHAALFAAPLCAELAVALQVESEGRARYVREREIAAWGLTAAEILEVALGNLEKRSARFRLVRHETEHGVMYGARTGDGHDSARVLLPALYDELGARLGAEPVLGIPHRDAFFACADEAGIREELARRTEHDAARAPHKLSACLYRLVGPGVLAAV
jgi:uncharacterized protein YtpQ (UPF0354 family)